MSKTIKKVEAMSDDFLKMVWDALGKQVLDGEYDENLSMKDWALLVSSELTRRGIPLV